METISNAANSAASAASRTIWGDANTNATQTSESGVEPLSGQTGDVAKGEPYDAGNADIKEADIANPSTPDISSSTRERWAPDNTTGAIAASSPPGNVPGTDAIRPEDDQDKTDVTYRHQPASNEDRNTQNQQGAERPTESPKGDEVKAIKESKEYAEAGQNADTSGAGSEALSETYNRSTTITSAGDGDDGPQKESHGSGTGEKWVKTSGIKADGGNFDAAQAGAGKEADRILETKGIQRESPGLSSPQNSGKNTDDASEKKHGIRAKIKGILHKN